MKKKKKVIIIISIVCSLLVIWQAFSIYVHKGNLSFTICNMSDLDSPDVEIYIDGKKVLSDKLGGWHSYGFYSMSLSPKNHVAVTKINGDVSQKIKFNTILYTNIYVSYQKNSSDFLDIEERIQSTIENLKTHSYLLENEEDPEKREKLQRTIEDLSVDLFFLKLEKEKDSDGDSFYEGYGVQFDISISKWPIEFLM